MTNGFSRGDKVIVVKGVFEGAHGVIIEPHSINGAYYVITHDKKRSLWGYNLKLNRISNWRGELND